MRHDCFSKAGHTPISEGMQVSLTCNQRKKVGTVFPIGNKLGLGLFGHKVGERKKKTTNKKKTRKKQTKQKEVLTFSVLSATWALQDRTRPMETRWGKGVQEFPEKKNSNNEVRPNRGRGRWSWWEPSFPHSAQKCANCSREKAAGA